MTSIAPVVTAVAAPDTGQADATAKSVRLRLTAPPPLATCMPNADVQVNVKLTTEKRGFDVFEITAHHVLPNRDYTVFLDEDAGFPFGAAEYIGEFSADAQGNAHAEYHLIVQEAFASTIVDNQRVRVDLNHVGVWFADPKDDDQCLGANSPVTPFDGDNSAGVLAFSSPIRFRRRNDAQGRAARFWACPGRPSLCAVQRVRVIDVLESEEAFGQFMKNRAAGLQRAVRADARGHAARILAGAQHAQVAPDPARPECYSNCRKPSRHTKHRRRLCN